MEKEQGRSNGKRTRKKQWKENKEEAMEREQGIKVTTVFELGRLKIYKVACCVIGGRVVGGGIIVGGE